MTKKQPRGFWGSWYDTYLEVLVGIINTFLNIVIVIFFPFVYFGYMIGKKKTK